MTDAAKSQVPQPDSKGLFRLHRVTDREVFRRVWDSEPYDFTPWLADNLDELGQALGMTLALVGTEVQVGEFRLDIQANDGAGRVVAIENQLERTDHGHLGQSLVYASALGATTVVWVAREFRDDFRRALDWSTPTRRCASSVSSSASPTWTRTAWPPSSRWSPGPTIGRRS
jgi:hypothetical protein